MMLMTFLLNLFYSVPGGSVVFGGSCPCKNKASSPVIKYVFYSVIVIKSVYLYSNSVQTVFKKRY